MSKDAHRKKDAPPTVTRGLDSQKPCDTLGAHWFRVSFDMLLYDVVLSYLLRRFGDADSEPHGFWRYNCSHHWPSGMSLYYDDTPERCVRLHRGRFALEVPGRAIEAMGQAAFFQFMADCVRDFSGRVVRLDVFYDDQERTITPQELVGQIREVGPDGSLLKHDWTRLEKCELRVESDLFEVTKVVATFGSRGKDGDFVRYYDKALESKGENSAVRLERELADKKAQGAVALLLEAYESNGLDAVEKVLAGLITGAVDFRYRSEKPDEPNLSRLRRYEWWQKIIDKLALPIHLSGRCVRSSVSRSWTYLKKLAPTFRKCELAMTPEVFQTAWVRVKQEVGLLDCRKMREVREYQLAVCDGIIEPPA